MQAVGVDVGYGVVKWVGTAGRGLYAAAWGPYTAGAEVWGIGTAERPLLVDGQPVLVGNRAAARPGARRPYADGRLADPEALPLLAQALWAAGVQGDIVLGSGTPLGAFAQEREAARAAWEGRTLTLGDGTRQAIVRVVRLVLRPQGVGAALYLAGQRRLPDGAGCIAIIDVGTRTTDVLTLEAEDLSAVTALSFSLEAGVATAAEALAADVQRETGHLPPADIAQGALRATVAWRGRTLGGTAAASHLDALAATIGAEVGRRFGADAGRVSAVAVVGGGGVLLGGRLRGVLPGEPVAVTADEAVYANALGFAGAAGRVAMRAAV